MTFRRFFMFHYMLKKQFLRIFVSCRIQFTQKATTIGF